MRIVAAGVAGLAVFEATMSRSSRPAWWGAGAAALVWQPLLVGPAAWAVWLLRWRGRLAARRGAARAAEADVPLLAELVAVGLNAGLSFSAALEAAAAEVHPALADEAQAVLRRARHDGLAGSLTQASGAGEQLYRVAARAVATGAPLLPAVDAFVAERRHLERTARQAAARRLPVRLLLPLALLILPGFVLLTVGPTLLGALERLQL